MSFRDLFSKSPAVGIIIAAVLLVMSILLLTRGRGGETGGGIWYYDLTTTQRVAAPSTRDGSPVTLPSGNTGVVARVFACGDCDGDTFIGYVEKPHPQPPQYDPNKPFNPSAARLVAAVPESSKSLDWHAADSQSGADIVALPQKRCGQSYRECLP